MSDTAMSFTTVDQEMVNYFTPFTLKVELEIKRPTFSDTDVESPKNALELDDVAFPEWPKDERRHFQLQNPKNVKGSLLDGPKSNKKECSKKLEFPKFNFNFNLISKLLNR